MSSVSTINKIDVVKLREEFPILHQKVNGRDLVYFDNAATTQKPKQVIQAIVDYYQGYNANIHRGIHTLAEKATRAFEDTREAASAFVNARSKEEIIFLSRGVTEGVNLVAHSYGRTFIKSGDEIIVSAIEHHSNIVPWQMVCEEKGSKLRVIPVNDNGELIMEEYLKLLSPKTKMVVLNHVSNSLGTINPIKEIIAAAHDAGAVVLVDGAQAAAHLKIDVQDLDVDFYCISAHKMYGPTGAGVLYGKRELLEKMPPFFGGGEMIKQVTFEKTTYNDLPYKFEAGTPNIADTIALKPAIDFINGLTKDAIAAHEHELLTYATERIGGMRGIRLIGTAKQKVGIVSFVVDGIHHFDIGQMLDARGIAVRTGHHCTQPLMDRLKIEGTVRASFAVYNTKAEIDQLAEALDRIINFLK
ncbi:MAG TPA: cysteine desulfurase [Cyclobacteriaceae bacterium]|nr:cysteine desulfurase [Cyclobacteriaceae bacterium]